MSILLGLKKMMLRAEKVASQFMVYFVLSPRCEFVVGMLLSSIY